MAKATCIGLILLFLVPLAKAQGLNRQPSPGLPIPTRTPLVSSEPPSQEAAEEGRKENKVNSDFGNIEQLRCKSETQDGLEFKYCISETDPSINPDVLFYLHREGQSESAWLTSQVSAEIRAQWKKLELAPPTTISVSFGPQWFLTESSKGNVRDLHAFFVNVLVAKLESQLKKPRQGQRMLMGESLGGFNAAMLLLKSGGVFRKVALICPALVDANPLASKKEIQSYVRRSGADQERLIALLGGAKAELPTQDDWKKHDVLGLAKKHLSKDSPELFLICDDESDKIGAQAGTRRLASTAQAKGVKAQFHSDGGNAKEACLQKLARFLSTPAPEPRGSQKSPHE